MSLPLHAVFLDRVIRIEAVQRERAAVTDEDVADFFEFGRVPGDIGKYLWLLDGAPEPFPMGDQNGRHGEEPDVASHGARVGRGGYGLEGVRGCAQER